MYREQLKKYVPPDFDLAKYEKSANMELVHWIENLEQRFFPFLCYQSNDIKAIHDQEEYLEEKILKNISSGIVNSGFEQFFQAIFIDGDTKYASIVKGLTYEDLFKLRDAYLTEELQKQYAKAMPSVIPAIREQNLGSLNDELNSQVSFGEVNLSWLKVDMNCSDSEIKTAFNSWLKKERDMQNSQNPSKRREYKLNHFNIVTFRKWYDARVLPYLDLVSWNFLKNNKVTSKILGEILFPNLKNETDPTTMVNDTVKPLSIKLISPITLRRMMAVLAHNHRQKNT